ncbi:LacI family DNA-binding transcriptional regulator [Kineosporia sp. A_224]|uniref:LacI family DNA-binding transcriptional regulator n=1 Tax=Kineosporia sp. A_224 TaxID=1962180 RepID=UPI000B4BF0E0|nr:LacI family DNA-binding transcriptional regulator [Kineosporia sp. A_224]
MTIEDAGTAPARRTTLADVARQAGVSTALVSLVMRGAPGASPANREKVFRVARELGYVPDSRARALRQGRSQLLGVMFHVQQPFHADVIEGVYEAAEAAGYDVVLSAVTDSRSEDKAIGTLLADRCEAVILVAPQSSREWLAEVGGRLPTVVLVRHVRHPDLSVVRAADMKGLGLAVDHLVGLGHRRIVHVDGAGSPSAEQRRRGYRAAMARHGLEPRIVRGGWAEINGSQAVEQLLAEGDLPTAILAFNDPCANGVLSTLQRSGISVPEEVSVVGFDDTHLAGFSHIGLTTVRQDAGQMARMAVGRAISLVERKDDPEMHRDGVVVPDLVVRGTTGPCRQ